MDLLKQVMRAAAPNVALALATQYHACLRPHEVLSLTVDCLSADQVRIDSNKKFRRANAHKVGPVQRKPVSHAAKKILNLAVQRARTAQEAAGDRLFDLSLAQYRKAVAGAVKKSSQQRTRAGAGSEHGHPFSRCPRMTRWIARSSTAKSSTWRFSRRRRCRSQKLARSWASSVFSPTRSSRRQTSGISSGSSGYPRWTGTDFR